MYGSEGDDNGPNACNPYADDVYSNECQKSNAISNCMDCYLGTAFAQRPFEVRMLEAALNRHVRWKCYVYL